MQPLGSTKPLVRALLYLLAVSCDRDQPKVPSWKADIGESSHQSQLVFARPLLPAYCGMTTGLLAGTLLHDWIRAVRDTAG